MSNYTNGAAKPQKHSHGRYSESEDRFMGEAQSDPRFAEQEPYDEAYGPPSPRRRRSSHVVDEWAESPEIEAVLIRVGAVQQAAANVRENIKRYPALAGRGTQSVSDIEKRRRYRRRLAEGKIQ